MAWQKTKSGLILPGATPAKAPGKARIPIKSGKVAKLWDIVFWTSEGVVHWTEESTGKYGQMLPGKARNRLRSIVEHVGKSTKPMLERDKQERLNLERQFDILDQIIKQATEEWAEKQLRVQEEIEKRR